MTAPIAASRLGLNVPRPVGLGNVRAQFSTAMKERADWYADVATLRIPTDHVPPEQLGVDDSGAVGGATMSPDPVEAAAEGSAVVTVQVDRPYDVPIGSNLLDEVVAAVPQRWHSGSRSHQQTLRLTAETVREALADAGFEAVLPRCQMPRTPRPPRWLPSAGRRWDSPASPALMRSSASAAVRSPTSPACCGHLAAWRRRGQVPTTLLAMVDAAVGGKTGINTAAGKNLVGSFHSPVAVVCDPATLPGMAPNDYVAGLAEVISADSSRTVRSCSWSRPIRRPPATRRARIRPSWCGGRWRSKPPSWRPTCAKTSPDWAAGPSPAKFSTMGIPSATRSSARRTTVGATARRSPSAWCSSPSLSRLAGRLDDAGVDLHRELLASVGLPVATAAIGGSSLLAAMKMDKKTRGDLLRFIVLDDIGRPGRLDGPDPALLVAAYAEVSE